MLPLNVSSVQDPSHRYTGCRDLYSQVLTRNQLPEPRHVPRSRVSNLITRDTFPNLFDEILPSFCFIRIRAKRFQKIIFRNDLEEDIAQYGKGIGQWNLENCAKVRSRRVEEAWTSDVVEQPLPIFEQIFERSTTSRRSTSIPRSFPRKPSSFPRD